MAEKKEVQERYMEYQMLTQQFQQIQQNIQALDKHVNDLSGLKQNIETISELKSNKETLIPLGNGIFLKGELKDSKNVIMNVGSDIFVEKTTNEAIETVEKQLGEVTNFLEQMQHEVIRTHARITELQEEFKDLRENELV